MVFWTMHLRILEVCSPSVLSEGLYQLSIGMLNIGVDVSVRGHPKWLSNCGGGCRYSWRDAWLHWWQLEAWNVWRASCSEGPIQNIYFLVWSGFSFIPALINSSCWMLSCSTPLIKKRCFYSRLTVDFGT